MLQIRRHEYFDHFNFIILFVAILPLYAINLDAFTYSSFTFLTILNDTPYQFEWINIVLFLSKKDIILLKLTICDERRWNVI